MENLNLVELLRDCPTGMELDCTVFDNVTFDYVNTEQNRIYCKIDNRDTVWFTAKGCINLAPSAKCVVFPKGKTTWEGFVPFVKGDIIYTDGFVAILFDIEERGTLWYYCYYSISEDRCKIKTDFGIGNVKDDELRLATEEEKQRLFDAIKARWGESEKEYTVFVGCYAFKDCLSCICSYDYSCLYEDKSICVKLLKVKKDGTPSERVERIWGDIVEIEILEQ